MESKEKEFYLIFKKSFANIIVDFLKRNREFIKKGNLMAFDHF